MFRHTSMWQKCLYWLLIFSLDPCIIHVLEQGCHYCKGQTISRFMKGIYSSFLCPLAYFEVKFQNYTIINMYTMAERRVIFCACVLLLLCCRNKNGDISCAAIAKIYTGGERAWIWICKSWFHFSPRGFKTDSNIHRDLVFRAWI